jgi:retron-type reverse transcriptase
VTWAEYGQDLEANLRDLHARVQQGRYRAKPSRRVYIPKPDGRQRPLGIASLEDKIVQRGVVEVLNAIYEVDFRGFSYGFRPGRKPHDALDALTVGITSRRVSPFQPAPWAALAGAASGSIGRREGADLLFLRSHETLSGPRTTLLTCADSG